MDMAHAKLDMKVTADWVLARAQREPESGITSVGGLADRLEAMAVKVPESSRLSLAKFIELSRRKMQLTVEQLAERADVELAELVAIEKGDEIIPEARTIYRLSQELGVKPEPLLELAGLVTVKGSRVSEAAVRFAARSEPMAKLSREEEEALTWFVKELTKV
jgi:transcriptional regulator with XRE-family HTH domain